MKLKTEEFDLTFERGELYIATDEKRRVYVNGNLVASPVREKPKFKWIAVKDGFVKKGDRVSNWGGQYEEAYGLIGWTLDRATREGWKVRRKIQIS